MARSLPENDILSERIARIEAGHLLPAARRLAESEADFHEAAALAHSLDSWLSLVSERIIAQGIETNLFLDLDNSLGRALGSGPSIDPDYGASRADALNQAIRSALRLDNALAFDLAQAHSEALIEEAPIEEAMVGATWETEVRIAHDIGRARDIALDRDGDLGLVLASDLAVANNRNRTTDINTTLLRVLELVRPTRGEITRVALWGAIRVRAWWYQLLIAWTVSDTDQPVELERIDPLDLERARELPKSAEALTQLASNMLQDGVWESDPSVESRVKRIVTYLTEYQRFPALEDDIEQRRAEGMVAQLTSDVAAVAATAAQGVGAEQISTAAKELSRIDGSAQDPELAEKAVDAIREAEALLLDDSDIVNESLDYTVHSSEKKLDGATLATAFGTAAGLALAGPTGAAALGAAALGGLPAGAAIGGIGGVLLAGAAGGKAGKQLAEAVGSIIAVATRALAAILRRFRPKDSSTDKNH